VDPDRAEALLRHFGSARKVFAADASALAAVEGIDDERAARIAAMLEYGS
jgi:ERCC4-type nuclease